MITDNELIRLLELADPARVDDPTPVLEPAEYRDALLTGRIPVTLVSLVPTPSEPSSGRRWLILIAAAAAVVVAVALVAARDDATPADQPTPTVTVPPTTPPPTVTVSPTTPPRALRDEPTCCGTSPGATELVPGTYFVDEVNGTPTPRIYFTIGAWWDKFSDVDIAQLRPGTGAGEIMFGRPGAVFADACHPNDGYHPGPVDTVDGFVAALSEQQGWAEVTAPSDISIDGYVGKAFQRTVPAEIVYDCDIIYQTGADGNSDVGERMPDGVPGFPDFRSWENLDAGIGSGGGSYEPGEIETLWILDIDGTVVVISAKPFPEASAADHAAFAAVLDSIRIERA